MQPYRYCVSLRITHPSIDPNEITLALGRKPVGQWRAGELRISPKGTILGGIRKESFWRCHPHEEHRLSSQAQYLEDYLKLLTDELEQFEDFLSSITSTGGRIEYFVGLFSENNIGNVFSSSLLKKIGTLNIDLSLDIYGYPE